MSGDAQAIFEGLAARCSEPMLRGIAGTCCFAIADAGIWRVTAQEGVLIVTPGDGAADSVVTCAEDDFVRAARGEQNPLTLLLRGDLSISGDFALVLALTHLFTPEQAAARG